jgi:hypothetical protein
MDPVQLNGLHSRIAIDYDYHAESYSSIAIDGSH